jgi:hypothetical protein
VSEKEFIADWITKLSVSMLKIFPDDFLSTDLVHRVELPGKSLLIGNEFFGAFEILTTDGKSFLQAESYVIAKFYVYSNRNKERVINIPDNNQDINEAVAAYEEYLDEIIKKIEKSFKKEFPDSKMCDAAINDIFRSLNINRY